ncbi:MAG: nucleotidyltransferase domain-containing protein [Gammaproteobacteria bacterium]|nr:nucleotidyltransferase domain-containing protein [Gammaproteobacteria bacterium]
MTTTTHARLKRTAVEAVGSIPGIEAVVLYGSRARGTARDASDWDIAILSHAAADDARAAEKLFSHLELVQPIVMPPESIEAHCNTGTRLEAAIARQGQLLAGDWTPPRCRSEDLDVALEDLKRNLHAATGDLSSAFLGLCNAAFRELLYSPNVVEDSQQAAESLAKSIIAGFGLSPVTVHDLGELATQLENAYRGRRREAEERRRFAAAIRELDGETQIAHVARYHASPVEWPERTAQRMGATMQLQTEWLRWYAERTPEFRDAAVAVGAEIVDAASVIEEMRGFGRIDPGLRAQVRAWGEDGGAIAAAYGKGTGQEPRKGTD